MTRNSYLRADVACIKKACGWVGTRKNAEKPCPKCGGELQVVSQRGGRTYDISRKPDAIPGGPTGPGSAWLARSRGAGDGQGISGTSIFDPVLCELAYRWFCPKGGTVLDPFAGGSVRGVIASRLERGYIGIDLSERQVAANMDQLGLCTGEPEPVWLVGDSQELKSVLGKAGLGKTRFDFIFTSPPYADLERYSNHPSDLSTLSYAEFRPALANVIAQCCERLAEDRFACVVIGDARDKSGCLYGLPAHAVQMFEDAGLRLYNDAILLTAIASLPVRVRRQFTSGRKLGRCHQYVHVFVKGDPVAATRNVGEVEFGEPVVEDGADAELAEVARLEF